MRYKQLHAFHAVGLRSDPVHPHHPCHQRGDGVEDRSCLSGASRCDSRRVSFDHSQGQHNVTKQTTIRKDLSKRHAEWSKRHTTTRTTIRKDSNATKQTTALSHWPLGTPLRVFHEVKQTNTCIHTLDDTRHKAAGLVNNEPSKLPYHIRAPSSDAIRNE